MKTREKKIAIALLGIIYLAFISLGLPDALLGSAWPVMRADFKEGLATAGLISMIIAGGTIYSSMNSGELIEKVGTGKLTLISCTLTALALVGISESTSLGTVIIMAIPLGLGAGAVDSALNHFVAGNYKVHHMNWLHAFWGIGATIGPLIMSSAIAISDNWRRGYLIVGSIQLYIVLILFFSIGLWGKVKPLKGISTNKDTKEKTLKSGKRFKDIVCIKGVKYTLAVFFLYCSVEITIGLWGASYLVESKGMIAELATRSIAIYYSGITIGRIINGFISMKINNRLLIFLGQMVTIVGSLLLILPFSSTVSITGLLLLGVGLAPIFPGLLHETPYRFGEKNAAKIMGYQMAVAYIGTTFAPPAFGLIASLTSIKYFPWFVITFLMVLTVLSEKVVRIVDTKKQFSY